MTNSALAEGAPEALRLNLRQVAASEGIENQSVGGPASTRYARQAFEGLVVKSANVVFTTTNSFELERLIDERGQFDWAIIEEAGKATGGELLSPLLLSHRRLMIGDHKQLAPFNSERIVRLLESPKDVRDALETGEEFIGRALRDPSTDEVLDELDDSDAEFPALCSTAIGCIALFERLIEEEFKLQTRKPAARKIAHRLTMQHRMHPAIARVISGTFYEGELKSHSKTIARFTDELCPFVSTDPTRMPEVPIVIVDMPWVQRAMHKTAIEQFPRWHNPDELEAVAAVVGLLRPREGFVKPPSLAILSPTANRFTG